MVGFIWDRLLLNSEGEGVVLGVVPGFLLLCTDSTLALFF